MTTPELRVTELEEENKKLRAERLLLATAFVEAGSSNCAVRVWRTALRIVEESKGQ